MADESVLIDALNEGGYDGASLVKAANTPAVKNKLRELTAEAKAHGVCGVPSYRILREGSDGKYTEITGPIWGQDEINVVEDLIAGWDPETSRAVAEPLKAVTSRSQESARL